MLWRNAVSLRNLKGEANSGPLFSRVDIAESRELDFEKCSCACTSGWIFSAGASDRRFPEGAGFATVRAVFVAERTVVTRQIVLCIGWRRSKRPLDAKIECPGS